MILRTGSALLVLSFLLASAVRAEDGGAFFNGALGVLKSFSDQVVKTSSTTVCETRSAGSGRIEIINLPECRTRINARISLLERNGASPESIAELRAYKYANDL